MSEHLDLKNYFKGSDDVVREFYIDYLSHFKPIKKGLRILEIGCGGGWNLLPFAELECEVVGIDDVYKSIEQARDFFDSHDKLGIFVCDDFITMPEGVLGKFDVVIVHDEIEHIPQSEKEIFVANIKKYMVEDGVVFFTFPAWQMPFGGYQQICDGFASKLPFIHILPNILYKTILKWCGESDEKIKALLDIKRCKMEIEKFESLIDNSDFYIEDKIHWFVDPYNCRKREAKPRRVNSLLSKIPYLRNYYTASSFYLLKIK